jgi:hypothetical protein
VRRLLLYLEESIHKGTQRAVFEPNEEPLWTRVRRSVTSFLITIWRNRALMGVDVLGLSPPPESSPTMGGGSYFFDSIGVKLFFIDPSDKFQEALSFLPKPTKTVKLQKWSNFFQWRKQRSFNKFKLLFIFKGLQNSSHYEHLGKDFASLLHKFGFLIQEQMPKINYDN